MKFSIFINRMLTKYRFIGRILTKFRRNREKVDFVIFANGMPSEIYRDEDRLENIDKFKNDISVVVNRINHGYKAKPIIYTDPNIKYKYVIVDDNYGVMMEYIAKSMKYEVLFIASDTNDPANIDLENIDAYIISDSYKFRDIFGEHILITLKQVNHMDCTDGTHDDFRNKIESEFRV